MNKAKFWQLRERTLSDFSAADWERYYPQMAAWLDHNDPEIRDGAIERLCMAVFRAEWFDLRLSGPEGLMALGRRAAWLLDSLEIAHRRHPDVLPIFLSSLRWHGDDEPFPEVLLPWLHARRADPRLADAVEGAILLVERNVIDVTEGRRKWLSLLDHPSNTIRGHAANLLGEQCAGDAEEVGEGLFAQITEKELQRPGIAGAFWSGWDPDHETLRFDPLAWMLDLVERRNGPEPDDMPFNGIDFHVHELAGDSAEAVLRLLDGGRTVLALQAATEIHDDVDGMEGVLDRLGNDADADIANGAHQHLAHYYKVHHPRADPTRLRWLPDWRPGVDAFVMRQSSGERWRDAVVFHPQGEGTLDDARAWRVIDAALPPEIRGDLAPHFLARPEGEPAPHLLGNDELREYASGALVSLRGSPEQRRWRRVDIIGRGLQGRWNPFGWSAATAP